MESPSAPDTAQPAASPLQFRLTTIFLSMTIVAAMLAAVVSMSPGPNLIVSLAALVWLVVCVARQQHQASGLLIFTLSLPSCHIWLIKAADEAHGVPARKSQCINNLKQITLALQMYEAQYKQFPPAYLADAQGRPMHSWRVLLLPYLEQQSLFNRYKFDEPWDGPNNRKLHDAVVHPFRCPSEDETVPGTMTSYLAVVGPGTMWDPQRPPPRQGNVRDGISNTLFVVECCSSGIHWMEPRDLHLAQMKPGVNAPQGQGICSRHRGGASAGCVNGSIHFLHDTTTADEIRALLSIDGGEPVLPP